MLTMPPAGRNGLRTYTIRRRFIDLSEPYIEPRGAIDAEIELPDRRLRVIVTHLGLRMRERYRQACKLRTALAAAPGHPAVLLRDFNDWFPTKPTLKQLTDLCRRTASPRSYPSAPPSSATRLSHAAWNCDSGGFLPSQSAIEDRFGPSAGLRTIARLTRAAGELRSRTARDLSEITHCPFPLQS